MVQLIKRYVEVLSKICDHLVDVLLTRLGELGPFSKHSKDTLSPKDRIKNLSLLLQVASISQQQLLFCKQLLLKRVESTGH